MTLSTADLEYIRSSVEDLLPDTCNILRATYISDDMGGMSETWGTVVAQTPCRLDAKSGGEPAQSGRVAPEFSYILTLQHDIDILNQDRVEKGDNVFSVISIDLDKSWIASRRVTLERI